MKIFTWCVGGSTPLIKNGVACPPYDDLKISSQPAPPSSINMTTMIRQHAVATFC